MKKQLLLILFIISIFNSSQAQVLKKIAKAYGYGNYKSEKDIALDSLQKIRDRFGKYRGAAAYNSHNRVDHMIIDIFDFYDELYYKEKRGFCSSSAIGEYSTYKEFTELCQKFDFYLKQAELSPNYYSETRKIIDDTKKLNILGDSLIYQFATTKSGRLTVDPKLILNYADPTLKVKPYNEACDAYVSAINRIKKDKSLDLSPKTITALENAIIETEKIKIKNDQYVTSGQLKKDIEEYDAKKKLEKFNKEKEYDENIYQTTGSLVEKSELNHDEPSFEAIAKKHALSKDYVEYSSYLENVKVVSVISVYTIGKGFGYEKNGLGVPLNKYKSVVVYFKNSIGQCREAIYSFKYDYTGGGNYSSNYKMHGGGSSFIPCDKVKK